MLRVVRKDEQDEEAVVGTETLTGSLAGIAGPVPLTEVNKGRVPLPATSVKLDARPLTVELAKPTAPEAIGAVEFEDFEAPAPGVAEAEAAPEAEEAVDDGEEGEDEADDGGEDEVHVSCASEKPARARTVNDGSESFIVGVRVKKKDLN